MPTHREQMRERKESDNLNCLPESLPGGSRLLHGRQGWDLRETVRKPNSEQYLKEKF